MIPSKNILPTLTLLCMILLCASAASAGVPMTVTVNKSVLINLKNPARYITIADKDIVDVPDPLKRNQLLVNGKKIGSTNMIVWEEGVEKPTFFDINVVGDQSSLEAQIREHSGPNDRISVEYAMDTIILSGTVLNLVTAKKTEEIAKAYSTKVLNHITIDTPQQVLLQVKVAQVDRSSLKKLGISAIVKGLKAEGFTNLVGAPSGATTISDSGTNVVTNGLRGVAGVGPGIGSFDPLDAYTIGVSYFPAGVGAVLQALASKGLAKILAEPNLLVKSGEEGDFLAGSKIPYSVLVSTGGAATTSIIFETVGVKLKFKPEVLENGLISLKLDPAEVSSIAGTLSVNGYPIIDTRDVRTSVQLRDGESLVLAGLLQEQQIKNMQKIPILGDIPILGALFRATHDEISEKELVFFITPKLVQPNLPGDEPGLPTERDTDQEEKELNWIPLGE
jgi:pilus assembly protein CpaC